MEWASLDKWTAAIGGWHYNRPKEEPISTDPSRKEMKVILRSANMGKGTRTKEREGGLRTEKAKMLLPHTPIPATKELFLRSRFGP